ncbi:MAG: PQQ-binding-like beta-propeller repeat protein [Anaerolineales bacterium]|nr:PQQ-binding-like beta-propeller repeat protein [Anaerolineales bacterium]
MLGDHSFIKIIRKGIRPRLAAAALPLLLAACAGGAPNQSWAGLAVRGDLAYLAHNYHISAVNLSSGEMVWKYPEEVDAKTLFYGDPLIDSQGYLVAGAYNGAVVKLNAETGTPVWKAEGDGEKIIAPIAEGPDGEYYVSSESGDLRVLGGSDGALIKRIPLDKMTSWGPMAVNGERIYIATIEHKVMAVNFESGAAEWTVDLGAAIAGGVNLVDGKLVVGTFTDRIYALDPQTGATLWEAAAEGWVWQAPISDGETVFAADLGGALRALALADGSPLWSVQVGAPVQAGPAAQEGQVFAGTSKGTVRAYSIEAGAPVWEQTVEGAVHGSLRLSGGKLLVVVSGAKYQLAALNPESGVIVWTYAEPT